ncbi:MAG: YtxH domain-containing protein [Actinomycetes bacterium]
MRIRTIASFVTGGAIGAASVYLLDPDHGRRRRREALTSARSHAAARARAAAVDAARLARTVASNAADGYRQERAGQAR